MSLTFAVVFVRAQTDSVSNSFKTYYQKENPALHYQYDDATQTHNYSDNWDFDSDGKKDHLFFIGTGGAHLYYYLRIILSSDHVIRNYTSIAVDMPMLPTNDSFKIADYNPIRNGSAFAVADFDGDKVNDIFIKLDHATFVSNFKQLKKIGISSTFILVSAKKHTVKCRNYPTLIVR